MQKRPPYSDQRTAIALRKHNPDGGNLMLIYILKGVNQKRTSTFTLRLNTFGGAA